MLAPFKDDAQDPKTVLASLLRLTRFVTDGDVTDFRMPIAPAERQMFLEAFAQTPGTPTTADLVSERERETELQVAVRNAEAAFAAMTDVEQTVALGVLGRLVRIGRDEEGGGYTPIRASLSDFSDPERSLVSKLASYNIVTITTAPGSSTQSSRAAKPKVNLTDARLLASWPTLIKWLDEHHAFLTWRQQLRTYLSDWERSGRDRGALLSGRLLSEADLATVRRADDLNEAEARYIEVSRQAAEAGAALPLPDSQIVPAEPDVPIAEPSTGAVAIPRGARSRRAVYAWGAAAAVVLAASVWIAIGSLSPSTSTPTEVPPPVAPPPVPTPQFVGLSSDEARKTGAAVGLTVEMTDGIARPAAFLEGVVVSQTPVEKTPVLPGARVLLRVSTVTAQTPTLARLTLSEALKALTAARLLLGSTASRYVSDAPVGTGDRPAAGCGLAGRRRHRGQRHRGPGAAIGRLPDPHLLRRDGYRVEKTCRANGRHRPARRRRDSTVAPAGHLFHRRTERETTRDSIQRGGRKAGCR